MNRSTSLLSASAFLVAMALALPASAQQVDATPPAAPAPVASPPANQQPTVPITSTTTTTAADSDTTAGPSASEPRNRDTVTVSRYVTPNRPWLITGGLILVATYVPTAVVASTTGRSVEDRNLYIPVIGPWLNVADRRCGGCQNETGNIAMVVGSGVLQGIGTGMTLLSFLIPEKMEAATIQAGPVKMHVTPWQVGRTGMGLGTVGVF